MCDPVSMVAVGTMAVSGGMQAYGQYQEGKARASQYQYQGNLAAQEAKLVAQTAKQQRELIQIQASEESKQLARKVAKVTGAQKTTLAAMGIRGKTAEDIALSTFDQAKLDEMAIKYNADTKSWAIREQEKQDIWALRSKTGQLAVAGQQARISGRVGAFGTLLGTASSVATATTRFRKRKTRESDIKF